VCCTRPGTIRSAVCAETPRRIPDAGALPRRCVGRSTAPETPTLGYAVVAGLLLSTVAFLGCRDREPPRPFAHDLGKDGIVLLPLPSPRYTISSVGGADRADWIPLRDPIREDDGETEAAPDDDTAVVDETAAGEVEAEVRELITDYNSLAAEGDIEELLAYYVEPKRTALQPLLESALDLARKVQEIRGSLADKFPTAVETALSKVAGSSGAELIVESVVPADGSSADISLGPGNLFRKCRAVVLADEWFLDLPDDADFERLRTDIDAALAHADGLLAMLSAGELSAETLESALAAFDTDSAGSTRVEGEAELDAESED